MENFLEGFNIWNMISTGAVGIAVFYFQKYNAQMEAQVTRAVNRIAGVIQSNDITEKELRKALNENMDAMGKATKAINGDMLKIEKSVFEIKKEINDDIEFLKGKSSDINRDFQDLGQRLELAIEAFDERYGRFVQFGERLREQESKVYLLEQSTGKIHQVSEKNAKTLSLLEQSLKNMLKTIKMLQEKIKEGES